MIKVTAIFLVGLSVGFLNGFAGGASVLSFPAMIAIGLNPVTAAMTNALGVWTANIGALVEKFKPTKSILSSVVDHDPAADAYLASVTQFHRLSYTTKVAFTTPVGKPQDIGADRLALAAAAPANRLTGFLAS